MQLKAMAMAGGGLLPVAGGHVLPVHAPMLPGPRW